SRCGRQGDRVAGARRHEVRRRPAGILVLIVRVHDVHTSDGRVVVERQIRPQDGGEGRAGNRPRCRRPWRRHERRRIDPTEAVVDQRDHLPAVRVRGRERIQADRPADGHAEIAAVEAGRIPVGGLRRHGRGQEEQEGEPEDRRDRELAHHNSPSSVGRSSSSAEAPSSFFMSSILMPPSPPPPPPPRPLRAWPIARPTRRAMTVSTGNRISPTDAVDTPCASYEPSAWTITAVPATVRDEASLTTPETTVRSLDVRRPAELRSREIAGAVESLTTVNEVDAVFPSASIALTGIVFVPSIRLT